MRFTVTHQCGDCGLTGDIDARGHIIGEHAPDCPARRMTPDTTRTEHPLTEAGRELVKDQQAGLVSRPIYPMAERVAAIELEAAAEAGAQVGPIFERELAQAEAQTAAAVEALRELMDASHGLGGTRPDWQTFNVAYNKALAIALGSRRASARFIADVEKPWREAVAALDSLLNDALALVTDEAPKTRATIRRLADEALLATTPSAEGK